MSFLERFKGRTSHINIEGPSANLNNCINPLEFGFNLKIIDSVPNETHIGNVMSVFSYLIVV
jgi:hypothetical protein